MPLADTAAPLSPGRSRFFLTIAAVAVLAVTVGFGRTYAVPMVHGTLSVPAIVHLHGALAFAWVLLFATQALLVRRGRRRWHQRIGQAGMPLAVGVAITMLPAGVFQVTRDMASDAGPAAISAIVGVCTSALLFVTLVGSGVWTRRNREAHTRWLLLATLVVLWPAWFRFRHYFPAVPRPDVWFGLVLADVWIVIAMLRDRLTRGAVHPVLLWAGTAVIAEQTFEMLVFDAPWWRAVAGALYAGLRTVGA